MIDNFDDEAFKHFIQNQIEGEGWIPEIPEDEPQPAYSIRNDNTVALESIANSLQSISKSLD